MLTSKMPCLRSEGLAVFTATPEQRLLLGKQWFNATHLPIQLRRYVRGKAQYLHEDSIFNRLQSSNQYIMGNQVFVLYGAAGSGKSELMSWIELRLKQQTSQRPIIRITRTELDVLSIIGKLKHLLTGNYFTQATLQRWEQMRLKPRTLAKLLTLRALEHLLSSDDLINALFYRLMEIVEPQISTILANNTSFPATDIISRDAFDKLKDDTVIPISFDFEAFRIHLMGGFQEMMLENMNIKDTLGALSAHFQQIGQRPLLLIDDLVQSINLFATEFLDYFITLDQGNWDVVIGITPASFQSDSRGRELLERINNLDTIDDRVEKLWLSDEYGLESSFLKLDNIVEFTHSYLNAFRHINGIECSTCPILQQCNNLQHEDDALLAPFNTAVLHRLFRGLPDNKGKVRAFITTLRHILEAIIAGQRLDKSLLEYASSELYVACDQPEIAELLKWYVDPFELDNFGHILDFFELPVSSNIQITTINKSISTLQEEPTLSRNEFDDPSRLALRDWLEGKSVNRQLLQKFRKGVATWLRGVQYPVSPGAFHHPNIARPNKILRDASVEMDTSPPISIEAIDDFDGIKIPREIGYLAFKLADLSEVIGTAQITIRQTISQDPNAIPLIWSVNTYTMHQRNKLEAQLGLSLDQFTITLFTLRLLLNGSPTLSPPGINQTLQEHIDRFYADLRYFVTPLPSTWVTNIDKLLDDFFKLRDNIYDSSRLLILTHARIETLLGLLKGIQANKIDKYFHLGNTPLYQVVEQAQIRVKAINDVLADRSKKNYQQLSPQTKEILGRLQQGDHIHIEEFSPSTWQDLHNQAPEFYSRMQIFLSQQSK